MTHLARFAQAAVAVACLSLSAGRVAAQPVGGDSTITLEAVDAAVKSLDETPDLDPAVKATAKESLAAARASLESARKHAADATRFSADLERAATERTAPPAAASEAVFKSDAELKGRQRDLPHLDPLLANFESALAAARLELARLQDEPRRRADRSVECNRLDAEARKQLETLAAALAAPAQPGPVGSAAHLAQAARQRELEAALDARGKELNYYKQTNDLVSPRRERAEQEVARLEKRVKELEAEVNAERLEEAEHSAEKAAQETEDAAQKHPAVLALAEANAKLSKELTPSAERLKRAAGERKAIQDERATLAADYEEVKDLVEKSGLTDAVGIQLRQRHTTLPDPRTVRAAQLAREAELSNAQIEYFRFKDEHERLAGYREKWETIVEELFASLGKRAPATPSGQEDIDRLVQLLEQRRAMLDTLQDQALHYIEELSTIEAEHVQHAQTARDYAEYIDGRVLWIRSTEPLDGTTLAHAWRTWQHQWLGGQWLEVLRTFGRDFVSHPLLDVLLLAVFGPWFLMQRKLRRHLWDVGEQAAKSTTCRFWFTARAIWLTALISAFWPALLWTLGWRLGAPLEAVPADDDATQLARALASGLQTVAIVYLAGDLLRHLCRGRGLAEAHFGWPQSSLRSIRRNVRWLMVFAVPLALVVWTMEQHPDLQRNSLGRLAFIGWLLAAAVFLQRVLSPNSGVLSELIAYNRGGWLDRLSFAWRPLAIGGPVALALLAAVGYYYTAIQLVGRLQATAWLLLGALVAWAVVLRWLLLARRQMAINQARQRREAALAQADAEASAAPAPDALPELNLSAINTQTRQLIASFAVLAVMLGVWLIWVDVLPALGMLDRFVVWGEKTVGNHVTLSDAFVVLVIATMTTIAARNIPGLLEIAILQRLPLDSGLRYAVTAVSKYLITIVGITAACAQMGIRWEKVQWLVAAISVGLGFGLQEIFANFISGLIILFERPVRPGDVVTVGDVTGCVTQIRIRATTITDWDRKELLVPNKELISGRVVNWTLSDRVVRLTVKLGVAYGSDVARVTQILTRLINEQSGLLSDPPPSVTFEGFGESTLDFVVRGMLISLDETLRVKHQLNTKIEAEFRAAGIEIAYPQRDVHVRSLPAELLPLAFDRRRTEEAAQRKRPA